MIQKFDRLIRNIIDIPFLVKSDNAIIKSVEKNKDKVRCFQCSYGDLTKQSQDHSKIWSSVMKIISIEKIE